MLVDSLNSRFTLCKNLDRVRALSKHILFTSKDLFIHTKNSYWRLEYITTTDIISITNNKNFDKSHYNPLLKQRKTMVQQKWQNID